MRFSPYYSAVNTWQNCYGFTNAAMFGHLNVLQQLWLWAGEYEGLRCNMLTAHSCNAFVMAANLPELEILQQLCVWAGEYEGISRELLISGDGKAFANALRDTRKIQLLWT